MQEELNVFREISAQSQQAEEKKQKNLERQKKIVEEENKLAQLEATGRKEEAKAQSRKVDRLKREARTAEENESYKFGESISSKFDKFRDALADQNHAQKVGEDNLKRTMEGLATAIKNMGNEINNAISTYASYQTKINARL